MMENIAIVSAKAEGVKLVNRLGDNANYSRIFRLVEKIVGQKRTEETMRSIMNILESDVGKDKRNQQ